MVSKPMGMADQASVRWTLAAYGSLRPGEKNASLLAGLPGRWSRGWVMGVVRWRHGYPLLERAGRGRQVPVMIFRSPGLAGRWRMLDRFEGKAYHRVVISVRSVDGGIVPAQCYVSRRLRS
jgi:gamma-glutamylcyclotransferase (GGCT)/AIG2-like uncharacterized protein YtfP